MKKKIIYIGEPRQNKGYIRVGLSCFVLGALLSFYFSPKSIVTSQDVFNYIADDLESSFDFDYNPLYLAPPVKPRRD